MNLGTLISYENTQWDRTIESIAKNELIIFGKSQNLANTFKPFL